MDGTLCSNKNRNYRKSKPDKKAIHKVNELYEKGNYIIIYTARFMGRFDGNVKKAKKAGYQMSLKQLKKWKVKFHRFHMGKIPYDVLVDDRAFGYSKNWIKKI